MKIFIVDPDPDIRSALLGRVREAVRNVELRRPTFLAGDFEDLRSHAGTEEPGVGFLGPGCYQTIEQSVERFKSLFPKHPVAVVLDNDVYASEAFELRRFLAVRLMPLADIAQMAQFVLDSCSHNSGSTGG